MQSALLFLISGCSLAVVTGRFFPDYRGYHSDRDMLSRMDHHERQRYLMNSHHRIMRMDVRTGAGTAQEVKESEENFHHSEEKDNLGSNEAMNEDDNKVNADSNEHTSHESPEEIFFPIFSTFDVMRAEEPKSDGKPDWKGFRTLLRKLMEDAGLIISNKDNEYQESGEGNIQSTISNESEKMKPVDFIQGHSSDEGVAMPPKNAEENKSGEQVVQGHSSIEGLTTSHKDADDEVSGSHISYEPKMKVPEDFSQVHISDDIEMTKPADFFLGHSYDDGVGTSPKDIVEEKFFPVFSTIVEMRAVEPKAEGQTVWEVLRTLSRKLMEDAVVTIEGNIQSTISNESEKMKPVDIIQGHSSDEGVGISPKVDGVTISGENEIQGHTSNEGLIISRKDADDEVSGEKIMPCHVLNKIEMRGHVDSSQGHILDEIICPIFTTIDVMNAKEQNAEGKRDWEVVRTLLRKVMEDVGLKIMPGHISHEPKMRVPEDFRQAHISDDIEMTKLVDFFQGHSSDVGVRFSPKNIFEDIFFPVFTTIFEMGAEKPKAEGKTDWEVLRTGLKKLMEVAVAIISNKDNEYQESGEENIPSRISSTVDFIQGHTSDDGLSISHEDDCDNDSDEEIVQGHILGISEFTHDLNSDEIGILKAIDHSPSIVNSEILDHAFLEYLDKFKLLLHQHQQMLPYYATHMRPLVNTAAQYNRDDNNSHMHEVLVKALSDSLKAILKEI